MKSLLVLLVACLSVSSLPVLAAKTTLNYAICKSHKVVRTIRVDKASEGCETTYTKSGRDKVVGTGINPNSCTKIFNNIKTNLEGANWNCKEVASNNLSVSIEEESVESDSTFE